jgi:hypothetical protein
MEFVHLFEGTTRRGTTGNETISSLQIILGETAGL